MAVPGRTRTHLYHGSLAGAAGAAGPPRERQDPATSSYYVAPQSSLRFFLLPSLAPQAAGGRARWVTGTGTGWVLWIRSSTM